MTSKRPFVIADLVLLVIVLGVAAGARVGYLLYVADGGATAGPLVVQEPSPVLPLPPGTEMRGKTNPTEFDALVHNLSEHGWFGSLAPLAERENQAQRSQKEKGVGLLGCGMRDGSEQLK